MGDDDTMNGKHPKNCPLKFTEGSATKIHKQKALGIQLSIDLFEEADGLSFKQTNMNEHPSVANVPELLVTPHPRKLYNFKALASFQNADFLRQTMLDSACSLSI